MSNIDKVKKRFQLCIIRFSNGYWVILSEPRGSAIGVSETEQEAWEDAAGYVDKLMPHNK